MFDYLAICVETANENASSICQLGFASVKNGKIVGHFSKNIITKEEFDPFFSHIHGIGRHNLNGAVAFSDIHKEIHDMLEGQIVVTPSVFDRIVFTKAMKNNNLIIPNIKWLDLTSITKNTWPEWNNEGYTLGSINEQLLLEKLKQGSPQKARVVATIIQKAIEISGKSIVEWADLLGSSITSDRAMSCDNKREFDGEEIVFEGEFYAPMAVYDRFAAVRGFNVSPLVTKATTLLCVGLLGVSKNSNSEGGENLTKASNLIQQGMHIRIIDEDDLCDFLSDSQDHMVNEISETRRAAKLMAEEDSNNRDKNGQTSDLADEAIDLAEKIDHELTQTNEIAQVTTHEEKKTTPIKFYLILFALVFVGTLIVAIFIFSKFPSQPSAPAFVEGQGSSPPFMNNAVQPKTDETVRPQTSPAKKTKIKPNMQ